MRIDLGVTNNKPSITLQSRLTGSVSPSTSIPESRRTRRAPAWATLLQRRKGEDTRVYRRNARAAEMAVWEASGGDVLRSE